MTTNTDLTTITNRDVLAIVEIKNYSTTSKRRLYANAILKVNDVIEQKYTLDIFVLKFELLVAVVDRSGALLFKLAADFSVDAFTLLRQILGSAPTLYSLEID